MCGWTLAFINNNCSCRLHKRRKEQRRKENNFFIWLSLTQQTDYINGYLCILFSLDSWLCGLLTEKILMGQTQLQWYCQGLCGYFSVCGLLTQETMTLWWLQFLTSGCIWRLLTKLATFLNQSQGQPVKQTGSHTAVFYTNSQPNSKFYGCMLKHQNRTV